MPPSVGIITRTKNRPVLLRRAIESVVQQTYPNWVMVIVNDGGDPADIANLLERYQPEARGRITAIHNPVSLGMEGASKVGLQAVETDLLIVHDDDDSWAPEFLNITVHELMAIQRRFPKTQGVTTYSHQVLESVRGNFIETESVAPYNDWITPGFLSLDRMLAGNLLPPVSFLFSRKAFLELDSCYEKIPYLGDWDFLIRFLSRFDIYVIPRLLAFYHWRIGAGQDANSNTVTAEVDQHRFYRQYLLNEWLRCDFQSGKFGIGAYANLRAQVERILAEASYRPPAPPPAADPKPPEPEVQPPEPEARPELEVQAPQPEVKPPQFIVDYYWDSLSWRLTRPLRSGINRLAGRPPELKPAVITVDEAWHVARVLQESLSWNLTAPVRWLQSLAQVFGLARRPE
jgi:glycosyltransferase involved in cell wall biosynthesis